MTRTIDPNLLAALSQAGSPVAIAVQFAVASTTGGSLARETTGLVDLVDFSTLPNLSAFTVLSGSWALVGGELVATYPALSRSLIRYDSVGAAHGLVVQFRSTRPQNNPGDPDIDRSGFTAAVHGIDDANAVFMGVSPAGVAATDVPTIWQGDPATVLAAGLSGGAGTTYEGINFFGSGPALHRGTTGGATSVSASVASAPADGPAGLGVYWDMLGEQRQQDAAFQELRFMSNPWIRVYGLPSGWSAEAVNAAFGLTGSAISTGLVGIAGTGLIPLTWRGAPFQTIRVRDSTGALVPGVAVSDGAIGYGDIYKYTPPQPTPILNLCSADRPLELFGQTFDGMGSEGLTFDGIRESGIKKRQGVTLDIDAIDLDLVVNALKDTRHRGGIVRIWLVHYDPATGTPAGTPLLIDEGFSQGGFEVAETTPDDPREPRTSRIRGKIASVMAELQQVRGLRTNVNVHQRFYPGDTGFQNVVRIQGKTVYWGRNAPNAWVNAHRGNG